MVAPLASAANAQPRPLFAALAGATGAIALLAAFLAARAAAAGPLDHDALIALGAKVDARVADGEWYRLVVSVFLHTDAVHLAFNAAWLALFGAAAGALIGPGRALATALLAAVAGQLTSFAVSAGPSVGASGAVYGLAGLLLLTAWRRRARLAPDLRWRVLTSLAAATAVLLLAPLSFTAVDHAAHFGGLAAGVALAALPDRPYVARLLASFAVALLATALAAAWT